MKPKDSPHGSGSDFVTQNGSILIGVLHRDHDRHPAPRAHARARSPPARRAGTWGGWRAALARPWGGVPPGGLRARSWPGPRPGPETGHDGCSVALEEQVTRPT